MWLKKNYAAHTGIALGAKPVMNHYLDIAPKDFFDDGMENPKQAKT
jgi:hypothetical protein